MKKKRFKNLIAVIAAVCVLQTTVYAAQQTSGQPPLMKPPAKNQSNDFVKNTRTNNKKAKIEIYTDESGNQISKEQKERSKSLKKTYKGVTDNERLMEAMELMKDGLGSFSRKAILPLHGTQF